MNAQLASSPQKSEALALTVLYFMDIAVLKRVGPKQYEFYGSVPDFYPQVFPSSDGFPCVTPWEHSPMLEFFIDDAELFFEQSNYGEIASGVWQEDGKVDEDTAFIAIAANYNGIKVLIIRKLQQDYTERTNILRKAREQLLTNRELALNLEVFKEKSQLDGLTGLFNKATFLEIFNQELSEYSTGRPVSLIMVDIDNFKNINDTYGHLEGDMVLRILGKIFVQNIRRDDIIARYGGEEFIMLLPGVAPPQASLIGEKIRTAIKNYPFPGLPTITISAGCTGYIPGESGEEFIRRTDMALYDAKNSGKDKIVVRDMNECCALEDL